MFIVIIGLGHDTMNLFAAIILLGCSGFIPVAIISLLGSYFLGLVVAFALWGFT